MFEYYHISTVRATRISAHLFDLISDLVAIQLFILGSSHLAAASVV
jgi:hypothetical protein